MRGGKDGERIPMFPRLHVNDTDKGGGPRPPPRNKMALYAPSSQRFSSNGVASSMTLPVPALLKTESATHVDGQERTGFSSFYNPPALVHSERLTSLSDAASGKATTTNPALTPMGCGTSDAFLNLSSSSTFCLFRSNRFVPSKTPPLDKDEQRIRVTTVGNQGVNLDFRSKQQNHDEDRTNPSTMNSSMQLQTGSGRGTKRSNMTDLQTQGSSQNSDGCNKWPVSISYTRGNMLSSGSSSSIMRRSEVSQSSKEATGNSSQRSNLIDESELSYNLSARINGAVQEKTISRGEMKEDQEILRSKYLSAMRPDSCSKLSWVSHDKSLNGLEDNIQNPMDTEYLSLPDGVSHRNDHFPDANNVDSATAGFISPDDIVAMIGPQNFWRARKMILNQQRIFSAQVFELHRLIRVQKSLAGSAHLFLDDKFSLAKQVNKSSSKEPSPLKSIQKSTMVLPPPAPPPPPPPPAPSLPSSLSAHVTPPLPPLQSKNDLLKANAIPKASLESHHFLPPTIYDSSKGLYSGPQHQLKPTTTSTCMENINKLATCCFHPPPGNQWLVPVMSPSEGLVYKPYSGPYPPPTGFMAPVLGAFNIPPNAPQFFNQPYGISATHLQNGTNMTCNSYFVPQPPPPYGLSLTNSSLNEAVEPSLASSCKNGLKQWKNEFCPGSEVILCDESEVVQQKSVAGSGTHELPTKYALSLFPVEPTGQDSEQREPASEGEPRKHAIKVVPHDGRLASQSALKIFQLIQEERRHS